MKLAAGAQASIIIQFEPIGTFFEVADRDFLWLDMPLSALPQIEIIGWAGGFAVWLPWPDHYRVLDAGGALIEEL